MKKILILLAILFVKTNSFSQDLIRFYENAKVGYKDQNGRVIVPVKYEAGSEFYEGMALVLENRMRGFINNKGEVVIPFISRLVVPGEITKDSRATAE